MNFSEAVAAGPLTWIVAGVVVGALIFLARRLPKRRSGGEYVSDESH